MTVLRTLLASLVLLAAGLGVLAAATHGFRAYTSETVRRIDVREHPRPLPPTPLQTADGRHTSFGELRGRSALARAPTPLARGQALYGSRSAATICWATLQGGRFF